jgi:hypothetical protein
MAGRGTYYNLYMSQFRRQAPEDGGDGHRAAAAMPA